MSLCLPIDEATAAAPPPCIRGRHGEFFGHGLQKYNARSDHGHMENLMKNPQIGPRTHGKSHDPRVFRGSPENKMPIIIIMIFMLEKANQAKFIY
ncbi:hypothetical protein ElyMa_004244400 [Elysia marginata]|uniref:Uncharacterized protein n=1 Tax=Elysia marginata TaxID=1093978 RepID=A0AAV4GQZ3_9GAST|nr:hypothetical protein ElyMa_004244400 [Elysia marginata]